MKFIEIVYKSYKRDVINENYCSNPISSLMGCCEQESIKGQLISEWNFGVFKSSKKWTLFWQISALASKMGQIKKITAHYWAN